MAVVQTLIGNVKGPAGATGATGATGPQGDAATIAVGSVTSAAYGTPASVTNSGTSGAAVFDFVIPQGKPGEKTTKMGELTLDTITTSTDSFPSPAVDDTGAIAFGKIRKFFADTLSALASKIDTNKIADNLTTNDPNYVLSAAQGKALNDSMSAYADGTNGLNQNVYTGQVTTHVRRVTKYTGLKMAHLELALAYNIDIPANTAFASVSENFRPKANTTVPFVYSNSSSQIGFGSLYIGANGAIQQGNTSSMRNVYVNAWYPTN